MSTAALGTAAVIFYLLWCWRLPYAPHCPLGFLGSLVGLKLCSRQKSRVTDRWGNYRPRKKCPVCKGRDWPRLGARLFGYH